MNFMKAIVAAGLVAASTSAFAADITGAGATFPFPIYSKWADAYKKETGNGLNYQSIGSGAGIKQIQAKTVTFGATDMPLKVEQLEKDGLVQWPMVMGAIVPVVNLEGVKPGELVFDGETLANIYLGKITKWDDPAIAKLNPKLKLPTDAITVVRRSDGSGTTFNFTDYLSKVSADWKTKVGSGTAVEWPAGVGAKGNEGVAGNIGQTKNSIGYVEYAYAKQNKLTYAALINKAGKTVQPTDRSVPGRGVERRLGEGSRLLRDPHRPAGRNLVADHGGDLHPDAQGAGRQGGVRRSRQVLQMGFREGRQDGRGTRLHSDAGAGGQADREDLVGRHQELIASKIRCTGLPRRAHWRVWGRAGATSEPRRRPQRALARSLKYRSKASDFLVTLNLDRGLAWQTWPFRAM